MNEKALIKHLLCAKHYPISIGDTDFKRHSLPSGSFHFLWVESWIVHDKIVVTVGQFRFDLIHRHQIILQGNVAVQYCYKGNLKETFLCQDTLQNLRQFNMKIISALTQACHYSLYESSGNEHHFFICISGYLGFYTCHLYEPKNWRWCERN